jgi:DNA-binding MarR family transcriptional regulator
MRDDTLRKGQARQIISGAGSYRAPIYTEHMKRDIREGEYAALAQLRYHIREFVRGSDDAARAADLEPQQYQLLLAVRACPNRRDATIRHLADRLHLKHHSVVGLVDRLERHGYVRRERGGPDQRHVLVKLLPHGQRALERVVRERLHEVRESGHALVSAISAILEDSRIGRRKRRTDPVPRLQSRRKQRSAA